MARARNIKPNFFTNEKLAELPFSTRLMFIGLWTMCDRLGRMEDRPKRIKMNLFPADRMDVNKGLDALAEGGFIKRYEVEGERFIEILNFVKHQNPHVREAASTIPAPVEHRARHSQDRLIPEPPFLNPESIEEGVPPPAKNVIEMPPVDNRKSHPAIVALHATVGIYPPKEIWDEMIDQLGTDIDQVRMKKAFVQWRARGFNKTNYDWATDWYVNGIPEQGKRNGANRQHINNQKQSGGDIIESRPYR